MLKIYSLLGNSNVFQSLISKFTFTVFFENRDIGNSLHSAPKEHSLQKDRKTQIKMCKEGDER